MFTALYTAKSGMTVQQTNIDLHSHNLSNVSTTGFKRNFANVEDLAYQNYRQVGAAATEQNQLPTGLHMGLGARTVSIGRNFEQGSLQESKNSLDVAINGNGFFEVTMPDGTIGYTRDGSFKVDAQGRLKCSAITDPVYKETYEALPIGYDFSGRQWFKMPMQSGDLHIMDVYQSHFTGKLIITVSCAVTDEKDNIVGVIGVDIQLEELLKRARSLQHEVDEHDDND